MFDDCTTLTEMTKLRVELLSKATSDTEIMEINNAYNVKRKQLSAVTPKFEKRLTLVSVDTDVPIRKNYFVVKAVAPAANTLIINGTPKNYEVCL